MAKLRSEMAESHVMRAVIWGRAVDDLTESTDNDDVAAIVRQNDDIHA